MTLPDPATVVSEAGESLATGTVNVAITGTADPETVSATEAGYAGESAGTLGRLAAATATDAAVHYPDPDFTSDGPWLVLAPLSGFVSTVAAGRGRATVTLDGDGPVADRIAALLDAARPRHDHYPVAEDERGAFTKGMTTFALDSISVGESLTATFDVSTTPGTSRSRVESQFAGVPGLTTVEYESIVGVERASPDAELRGAVEGAHREVRGDCEYEWLPEPGVFAAIPGGEKVALGTGRPGAERFSVEQYRSCVDLLAATVANAGAGR
jgi:hypothetical protein